MGPVRIALGGLPTVVFEPFGKLGLDGRRNRRRRPGQACIVDQRCCLRVVEIKRTVIGEDMIVAVMRVDIVAVDRLSSKIEEIDGGGYGSHLASVIANLLLPSRKPLRMIAWIIVVKEHVRMRLGPPPGLKRPLSQIIGKCFEGRKLPVGFGRIGKGLGARIGRRGSRRAIEARHRSRRSWASRRGSDHRQQGAIIILHAL